MPYSRFILVRCTGNHAALCDLRSRSSGCSDRDNRQRLFCRSLRMAVIVPSRSFMRRFYRNCLGRIHGGTASQSDYDLSPMILSHSGTFCHDIRSRIWFNTAKMHSRNTGFLQQLHHLFRDRRHRFAVVCHKKRGFPISSDHLTDRRRLSATKNNLSRRIICKFLHFLFVSIL